MILFTLMMWQEHLDLFGDIPFTGVNQSLDDFDCKKTEQDTGFRAEISFGEGCKRTRDWWLDVLKEND